MTNYTGIIKKVSGIFDDSRKVEKDGLFVAIKGLTVDSHKFIDQAIEKGAKVVVGERAPKKIWLKQVKYIRVKNSRKALGEIASAWYGNPSKKMKIIGVTGTDGKTTTSYFIYQILKKSGYKVGLISTVGAYINGKKYDTGLHVTNPEALDLQKLLYKMHKSGCKYVILETTSHGIDQERIAGVDYYISVLTNITPEHLDYHKTFSNLVKTKSRLFEQSKIAVLNKKDKSSKIIIKRLKNKKIVFYDKQDNLVTNIVQDYNLYNLSAAIEVAKLLKITDKKINGAIKSLKLPTGRLQKIKNDRGLNIYVDFAHTPNSLKNILLEMRKMHTGKLIAVFGCAGERDIQKRPRMGKISTDIADLAIFTSEDPRYEDINKIFKQMKSRVKNNNYKIIPDRKMAIEYALIKAANKGDTVVILGKGHEQSMNIEGTELPWSDEEAVLQVIKADKYQGKNIAILGFGKEGREVAEYLKPRKPVLTVYDQNVNLKDKPQGFKYILGSEYLKKGLKNYDYIFRSPGFYRYLPEISSAEKHGCLITSEIKLFFEEFKGKIIAVTGTNGKGTTSTLVCEILKKAKLPTFISGNIGTNNLMEILKSHNKEEVYVVLELSSFQLIDLDIGPFISVVLNITTDHLNWHKNRKEYVSAKSQIVRNQSEKDFAVINADYKTSKSFANLTKAKVRFFSLNTKFEYKTTLLGIHNRENMLAAVEVAKILKISDVVIKDAVKNYTPMPHRLEFVREFKKIKFYNDSCSTSSQPTVAAIKSFSSPITLILGGSDKGLEFDGLSREIKKSTVKNIILVGQISDKIHKNLKRHHVKANVLNLGSNLGMRDIVEKALELTVQNEVVLLSPAATSFGMFESYADRGNQFKDCVSNLKSN